MQIFNIKVTIRLDENTQKKELELTVVINDMTERLAVGLLRIAQIVSLG